VSAAAVTAERQAFRLAVTGFVVGVAEDVYSDVGWRIADALDWEDAEIACVEQNREGTTRPVG